MAAPLRSTHVLLVAVVAAHLLGCADRSPPARELAWQATPVGVIEGFNVPECVVVDPADGTAYVSNIESAPGEYWADDGKGFISRLKPGGELDQLRWRTSTQPDGVLNGPKGMCIDPKARLLYVADNKRLVKYSLDPAGPEGDQQRPASGLIGERLNDMAFDGSVACVSDTAAGRIYKLASPPTQVPSPASPNGITFSAGRLFAVSWDLHEIYELDPEGQQPPKPFGLADHFKNLDGIEALDDGTFLVSDFTGNKVCLVSPDRKTVRTLMEIESPADIGIDRVRGLLYVPQFMKDRVAVFKLEKK